MLTIEITIKFNIKDVKIVHCYNKLTTAQKRITSLSRLHNKNNQHTVTQRSQSQINK